MKDLRRKVCFGEIIDGYKCPRAIIRLNIKFIKYYNDIVKKNSEEIDIEIINHFSFCKHIHTHVRENMLLDKI